MPLWCLFASFKLLYWLVKSSVLLTLPCMKWVYLHWFCPESTSSVRNMQWRSAGSRLLCLRAWEPSWRFRGFSWRRNWTNWAPKSRHLPWSWTQTLSHFLPTQEVYVNSGNVSFLCVCFFFVLLIKCILISFWLYVLSPSQMFKLSKKAMVWGRNM